MNQPTTHSNQRITTKKAAQLAGAALVGAALLTGVTAPSPAHAATAPLGCKLSWRGVAQPIFNDYYGTGTCGRTKLRIWASNIGYSETTFGRQVMRIQVPAQDSSGGNLQLTLAGKLGKRSITAKLVQTRTDKPSGRERVALKGTMRYAGVTYRLGAVGVAKVNEKDGVRTNITFVSSYATTASGKRLTPGSKAHIAALASLLTAYYV